VKRLYGDTPAGDFGPLALKVVRDAMIKADWARSYINLQTRRIVRMFKFAIANQMVPPAVLQGLQAVEGLRIGKTDARESEPVRPVPEPHVYKIRDHVSRQVWAMIELQLLTGMRPGEVVAMRAGEVDTAARPVWVYRPTTHKTAYRRAIARACDQAFPPSAPLARGEKETNKAWTARLTPDQRTQLGEWRRKHRWHPHQLRHTAATRLRKQFGLEAAQVILGHKTLSVTELYAEKNVAEAQRIMADAG
jgi:integrase